MASDERRSASHGAGERRLLGTLTVAELAWCVVASVCFVLVLSYSTSPLYPHYLATCGLDGGDSGHFLTIAWGWMNGIIPYRDAFDHKGPLLYLCDIVGFVLGGGTRYGIVAVQIMAISITLVYVLRAFHLVSERRWPGVVGSLVFLFFLAYLYNAGNAGQEYSMPLISVSLYHASRYLSLDPSERPDHDPHEAFVHGICFGAVAMIQLSNCLLIGTCVAAIMVLLLVKKRFANLLANIGAGLLGVAVMVVPFVIYFGVVGALSDFVFCTLIFNFSYSSSIESWIESGSSFLAFGCMYASMLLLAAASVFAWLRDRRAYALMMVLSLAAEMRFFSGLRLWPQYSLGVLPQVSIALPEIWLGVRRLLGEKRVPADSVADSIAMPSPTRAFRAWGRVLSVLVVLLLAMIAPVYGRVIGNNWSIHHLAETTGIDDLGYESVMDRNVDQIRGHSFTVYGESSVNKGLYLRYDLLPHNRFSLIQEWMVRMNPDLAPAVHEDFATDEPDYLLYEKDSSGLIGDVIDSSYVEVDENDSYILYRHL
jgi:hypothetical protein